MVQNTSSSAAFSAVSSADVLSSNYKIKRHSSFVRCVIVDDTPDGCGAMLRYKHATAECFAAYGNICYEEHGTCVAHRLHNITTGVTNEGSVTGHVYSAQYVCALPAHRQKLHAAALHLAKSELQVSL